MISAVYFKMVEERGRKGRRKKKKEEEEEKA
jgi:hypothetical protein